MTQQEKVAIGLTAAGTVAAVPVVAGASYVGGRMATKGAAHEIGHQVAPVVESVQARVGPILRDVQAHVGPMIEGIKPHLAAAKEAAAQIGGRLKMALGTEKVWDDLISKLPSIHVA